MIERLTVAVPRNIVPRETSERVSRFEKVTGIKKTRRYPEMDVVDQIAWALSKATLVSKDIRNVIVVTQTPTRLSPCMAVSIQEMMGLPYDTLCFDINHACDGWIVGLYVASSLKGRTLLICADLLRYGKEQPENLIFSDAVTITTVTPGAGIFGFMTDAHGMAQTALCAGLQGEMYMNGDMVFDFVTSKMPDFINSFGPEHDYVIPHQANLSMLKILEKRSKRDGKFLYSIEEYGNQSMNSVPTCIAMHEEKLLGKLILSVGFGAGFTAAALSTIWPKEPICEIVEY